MFSLYVPDYDTQYQMGWVFIIILSLAFLINIFFILFQMCKDFRLLCIKYWRRLKEWLKKWCPQMEKKETPEPPALPPAEEVKETPKPEAKKDLGLGAY